MASVSPSQWPSPRYLRAYLLLALALGTLVAPLPIEASARRTDTRPVGALPASKFLLNYPDLHAAIDQAACSIISARPMPIAIASNSSGTVSHSHPLVHVVVTPVLHQSVAPSDVREASFELGATLAKRAP